MRERNQWQLPLSGTVEAIAVGAHGGARRWHTFLVLFLPMPFVLRAETPPPASAIGGWGGSAASLPCGSWLVGGGCWC